MSFVLARAVLVAMFVQACASAASPSAKSTVATLTAEPPVTKPPSTQVPLPTPSHVRWAVDRTGDPTRPYFLDFFFDGVATSFRVVDGSGQVVLRVPIAGSGIFGPDTCVVRVPQPGKTENATWISVDAVTLEHFIRDAATYRIEADVIGGSVTLPLTDSGCRAG